MISESSNKSILFFCALLAIAIVTYSFARTDPFSELASCATLDQYNELRGQAYVLEKQLADC